MHNQTVQIKIQMGDYEQFENSSIAGFSSVSATTTPQVHIATPTNDVEKQKKRIARYTNIMWILCLFQFVASILITIFGTTCFTNTIVVARSYQ